MYNLIAKYGKSWVHLLLRVCVCGGYTTRMYSELTSSMISDVRFALTSGRPDGGTCPGAHVAMNIINDT